MLRLATGTVVCVLQTWPGMQLLELAMMEGDKREKAVSFSCEEYVPGDALLVNTTAMRMQLGTGGYHFVVGRAEPAPELDLYPGAWGHVMKLRYSPWQMAVDSVEEQASPYHDLFLREDLSLEGTPVLIGELHSLLPAAVIALKQQEPQAKIVYVMPDGSSLPIALSGNVHQLKQAGLLDATITAGHAWGGDFEAVTIHSGLLAARHVAGADVIVCMLGPGVAGTGTPFAFSGIQLAEVIHAVSALGGFPMLVPRISFADPRQRHYGISHHTTAILSRYALRPAVVCVPVFEDDRDPVLQKQLSSLEARGTHVYVKGTAPHVERIAAMENHYGLAFTTMGRTWQEDPVPFQTAVLAADWLGDRRMDLAEAFSADPHCFSSPDTLAALRLFCARNGGQP